ncbi:immediate early response gene 5 protein-like [Hetaerina americana]|uniref:immediate early response gene 5 protein-like n=1 Tax=Hetaerina americana TaxID=62018 RepID=UPI003A7F5676
MAAEARKIINLSLTKIAQSRTQKGGVSLHRNLLVATVLQRARFVYMEESYHMVQQHPVDSSSSIMFGDNQPPDYEDNPLNFDVCGHIASEVVLGEQDDSAIGDQQLFIVHEGDKENQSPPALLAETSSAHVETDSRLRDDSSILREKLEGNASAQLVIVTPSSEVSVSRPCPTPVSPSSLKKRRAVVAEWETEEAILSILPKRAKAEEVNDECDDSVFLDDVVTTLPDTRSAAEVGDNEVTSMEIDRITSLVSIFSFGGLSGNGHNGEVYSGSVVVGSSSESVGKLTKSVSTPDLCSAQAKESGVDVMQRPFLAMTV